MSSDDLWAFLLFIISPVYHVSIIHESFFIFLKKNCHGSLSLRVSTFPLSYEISILRASYKIFLFIFRKKGFLQDFWLMFIELHGTLTSRKVRTHKRRSTLYLGGANPPDERKEGDANDYIFWSNTDRYLHCRSCWSLLWDLQE